MTQTKKSYRYEEHKVQAACAEFLDHGLPSNYRWFAVPNGARTSLRAAARLKKEGMRAGVPDIVIVNPDGYVAFIEVKKPQGGSLSSHQKEFRDWCGMNGIPWGIVRSTKELEDILTSWNIPLKLRIV